MTFGPSRDFILLLSLCPGQTQSGRQFIAVPWCETIVAMETDMIPCVNCEGTEHFLLLNLWRRYKWMKNASEFLSVVRLLFQLPLTEIRRGFSTLCRVQTSGSNCICMPDSSAKIQCIYPSRVCFPSSFAHWKEIETAWQNVLKLYVYYTSINWITDGRIILKWNIVRFLPVTRFLVENVLKIIGPYIPVQC